MINKLEKSAYTVAISANGNPCIAILTVILIFLMFSAVEASIEYAIWGEMSHHWLDPFFATAFMAYSGLVVSACATFNLSVKNLENIANAET